MNKYNNRFYYWFSKTHWIWQIIIIIGLFSMPWIPFLLIMIFCFFNDRFADIEDKIDDVKADVAKKNTEDLEPISVPYNYEPIYLKQKDTIRSYSDERPYLRIRGDS